MEYGKEYVKELRTIANQSYEQIAKEKKEKDRHELANGIVELFENLLDKKDITIPCEDEIEQEERTTEENSAKLYGMEYWNLIDNIENLLRKEEKLS